jgi:thioredoxin reductase (NADPH)
VVYDCIIIGGGIAGLQAAIQLGRYAMHTVLVIDAGNGRSTLCRSYRNILGYPNGVSGGQLRSIGIEQASSYGVEFVMDEVIDAQVSPNGTFILKGIKDKGTYESLTLLLATGVMDRFPELPGLRECLGLTVFVCPDCDGYEVKGRVTLVLGAGDVGADMALTLRSWTSQLLYLNHEQKPVNPEMMDRLQAAGIRYMPEPIQHVLVGSEGSFQGVQLQNGQRIEAERAFLAFGGNEVKSALAKQLGAQLHENKHIWTDLRTKKTSLAHVWAAGDVAIHSEQVTIAMGEGAQAAIWIHKSLLKLKEKQ